MSKVMDILREKHLHWESLDDLELDLKKIPNMKYDIEVSKDLVKIIFHPKFIMELKFNKDVDVYMNKVFKETITEDHLYDYIYNMVNDFNSVYIIYQQKLGKINKNQIVKISKTDYIFNKIPNKDYIREIVDFNEVLSIISYKCRLISYSRNDELFGIRFYDYPWVNLNEIITVTDPFYLNKYEFNLFEITVGFKKYRFAFGAFSDSVAAVYIYE